MTSVSQYAALARRAILNTARQPATVLPSILFPLIFLSLSSAALDRSTSLPGFPAVDSFVQWAITASIVQGILIGSVGAGADMARDIEGGFFERLVASPVARTSIIIGRIAGAATLGFVQAIAFITIGLIFGVNVEGGFVGALLIALAASVLASGVSSLTVALGLRTGSSEAVQGSFPLIFVFLFMSSAFFPRNLMEGWFQDIATINPFSHLIEGLRTQIIAGVDIADWATALAISFGIFVLGVTVAVAALNGRLKATHS